MSNIWDGSYERRSYPGQKRMRISIKDDVVRVSAPARVKEHVVEKFVQEHREWITTQLRQHTCIKMLQ